MITQKKHEMTMKEEIRKQHGTMVSNRKKSVMLEKVLECPNCSSLLRTWYQSTVTKITCPKCWTEIPIIEDPQINLSEAITMG